MSVRRVAGLADPVVGDLVAEAALDVAVDAVVGDVELAADEPLGERQVPLEGRVERREPARAAPRPAAPRTPRSRAAASSYSAGRRVGLGGEGRDRAGTSALSARRFSISGRGRRVDAHAAPPLHAGSTVILRGGSASGGGPMPAAVRPRPSRPRAVPGRASGPAAIDVLTGDAGGHHAAAAGSRSHCSRTRPGAACAARPSGATARAARTRPRILSVIPYSPSGLDPIDVRRLEQPRRRQAGSAAISGPPRRRRRSPARCRCRRRPSRPG